MCPVDIVHLQTPSQFSDTGAKGMGEGGTIGAPAAVLNAINDALASTAAEFDHIPVLPEDVIRALAAEEADGAGAALAGTVLAGTATGGAAAGAGGGGTGRAKAGEGAA